MSMGNSMKEKIKVQVREKLSKGRIILFGAGEVAVEFYEEFKGCLNISHCVSNMKKEWGEGAFLDVLDIRQYRKQDLEENDYIIVCGPFAFRSIELQLQSDGLQMYEHFVVSDIAAAIWQNKKIALFYGQCVLRDIYHCMMQVEAFNKEYAAIYTQTAKDQAIVINRVLYYSKEICDLYIYTPKFLDRDSIYSLNREQLPEDCKILSVSNLAVPIYWPQVNKNREEINDLYLHPYNAIRDMIFYHTMFREEDCNINRMVREGKRTSEIVNALSSSDFYSEKQIKRNTNVVLKSIEIAEKGITIGIKDYILNNYCKEKIYQNHIHANKRVIWEYVRRILNEINISSEKLELLIEQSPEYIHHGGDMPIYPSVAQSLNLEFVEEDTTYEVIIGNGIVEMSFEEYIFYYVEYTRKALEIVNMW